MALTDKEQKVELIVHEFLQNAPRNNADTLLEYSKKFEERHRDSFTDTGLSPYCQALQRDPAKALEIMYVFFGGAADARLPYCYELQLDQEIPSVKKWVEGLRKVAPSQAGTIRNSLIRAAHFSLLAAAVAPDVITESEIVKNQNRLKDLEKNHDTVQVKQDIIDFYMKKFTYSEAKASKLAEKHMKIIAQTNSRLKF